MYAPPAQAADAAPQYGQDSYGNIYVMSAPAGVGRHGDGGGDARRRRS